MRNFLLLLSSLFASLCAFAQQPRRHKPLALWLDSALAATRAPRDWLFAEQYRYGRTDSFQRLGPALLDSLRPAARVSYWEINSWNGREHANLYRSDKHEAPDSVTLTREEGGFGPYAVPGYSVWYLSARTPKGTFTVHDTASLHRFLAPIDGVADAALWLLVQGPGEVTAPPTYVPETYWKAVPGGWLIRMRFTVNTCPISDAQVLYFVGHDGRIVYIRVVRAEVGEGCA